VATPAATNRATERFGIKSFVYTARRPFDAERLLALVDQWPLPQKTVLKEHVDLLAKDSTESGHKAEHPFARLLRSKGFIWLNTNPRSRVEWVQAGKHFGMYDNGLWWANFSDEDMRRILPTEEYERVKGRHFEGEFGDRRVELVFIGVGVDEAALRTALDGCLLTDDELARFRELMPVLVQPALHA
jgi:G3E family GTPase